VLKEKMIPPTFPIEYKDLKSKRIHSVLKDGDILYIGQDGSPANKKDDPVYEVHVMQAFAPSHPQQGALYYKIIDPDDGTKIACIWDLESHIGGDARVINFAKDADVMIHDTQYTDEEYADQKNIVQGFGHSSYTMALENAEKAHIKYLFGFHYNPRHNDILLNTIAKRFAFKAKGNTLDSNIGSFILPKEKEVYFFEDHQFIRKQDMPLKFSKNTPMPSERNL
jgi:hypothetical protein